jgi:hypothetical protein
MTREQFLQKAEEGEFSFGMTELPLGTHTARFTKNTNVMERIIPLADDRKLKLATMEMEIRVADKAPIVTQISCNDTMLGHFRREDFALPTYSIRVEERKSNATGNKYHLPIFLGVSAQAVEQPPIEDVKPVEKDEKPKDEKVKK